MKKKPTDSSSVFILSNIDKTIIRKYYVKGLKWYLSCVKQNYVFQLLEHSNIKHPRLLKSRWKYIELEYIPGRQLDNNFDKTAFMGLLCNYIYELTKINCSGIKQLAKWTNNTEFLHSLANNTMLNMRKSKCNEKLQVLGIGEDIISSFKGVKLDDQRPLSLIHGNINRDNIINNNGNFYLIDWEEATYGDVAYELAMNFINENYTKEEMGSIIERVCASNSINQSSFINDITLYITFEYRRRSIRGMINCIKLYKKGKNYNFLLENIYDTYSKIPGSISKEDVKRVIEGN